MDCPRCGLTNPSTSIKCDCGYDFINKPTALEGPQKSNDVDLYKWLFFSFEGRANRTQYLIGSLLLIVILVVSIGISFFMAFNIEQPFFLVLIAPIYLTSIIGSIFLGVKRLHDLNVHGAVLLLAIIPVINVLMAIIMLVLEGTKGPNQYGLPTKGFEQIGSEAGKKPVF